MSILRILRAIFRELAGLVVDDGSLALAILAIVLVAGAFSTLLPEFPLAAGVILLFGSLGVLVANVIRASQLRR